MSPRKTCAPVSDHGPLQKDPDVDGGWAWMVLLGASLGMTMFALAYTGGIFNIIFLEEFGMSKQTTAWVTALQSSLWSLGGTISSMMTSRLGARWTVVIGGFIGATGFLLTFFAVNFIHVFVTFGFMVGIGLGICYVPCIAVVGTYFKKYRNFSFGLSATAVGVGTMLLPPLITRASNHYGWRGCMLILSGIFLQFTVSGALFRPKAVIPDIEIDVDSDIDIQDEICVDANEESKLSEKAIEVRDRESHKDEKFGDIKTESERSIMTNSNTKGAARAAENKPKLRDKFAFMKNPGYILYCMSLFGMNVSNFITFIHFPAYFLHQGALKSDVSDYLTVLGVCNILSRFLCGVATNNRDVDVLLVYVVSCGISGILLLFCPLLSSTYAGHVVFSGLFGFYSNWTWTVMPAVTVKLVGVQNLSMAFGVLNMTAGIGGLVGPPFAGVVFVASCVCAMLIPIASSVTKPHARSEKTMGIKELC